MWFDGLYFGAFAADSRAANVARSTRMTGLRMIAARSCSPSVLHSVITRCRNMGRRTLTQLVNKVKEILKKSKTLSDETLTLRKQLDRRSNLSQSMMDLTASEHFEEIHGVRMTTVALHGSLDEKDKSLDQVSLRLDRSESQ